MQRCLAQYCRCGLGDVGGTGGLGGGGGASGGDGQAQAAPLKGDASAAPRSLQSGVAHSRKWEGDSAMSVHDR
jgi:hypothetical protein